MSIKPAYTYDDVCLEPVYDNIGSRLDESMDLSTWLTTKTRINIPILASNMDTVIGDQLANILIKEGSIPLFHRFTDKRELKRQARTYNENCYMSVGANVDDTLLAYYQQSRVKGVIIDVANSHSAKIMKLAEHIRKKFPKLELILGNVCTSGGYTDMVNCGAQAVKVGIGPGCFSASTKVLMADGTYKNINKIIPGEQVVNQFGQGVTVKGVESKGIRKVVRLSHPGWYRTTYVTPDHRFLVADLHACSHSTIQSKGIVNLMDLQEKTSPKQDRRKWMEVSSLNREKQFLLNPNIVDRTHVSKGFEVDLASYSDRAIITTSKVITNSNVETNRLLEDNYDLGYLIGTFLGDGSAGLHTDKNSNCESGSVSWYFNLKTDKEVITKVQSSILKVFGRDSSFYTKGRSVGVITLYSKAATRWFMSLSGSSEEKGLKSCYVVDNEEYLQGLFDGLIDSDGHTEANGRICFHNTSESLIELFTILCRFLKLTYSISKKDKSIGNLNNCKIENLKQCYVVRTHTSRRSGDKYWYIKYRKVEPVELKMEVWDIEVDCPTHSFIADGAIVHNSACSTRIITGFGIPQFTAIQECAEQAKKYSVPIIADGGIKTSGDVVKALAAGATTVMIGKLFALTIESAAKKYVKVIGKYEKCECCSLSSLAEQIYSGYRGQASEDFQNDFKGGLKKGTVAEGVDFIAPIPKNRSAERLIEELLGGLRSGMTYGGARSIGELQRKAVFRLTTPNYHIESNPRIG